MELLFIQKNLSIPLDELWFTTSRSGGPGGQNVNKVSSRVTLWFNVLHSPSLTEYERERLSERLATRINKEGLLQINRQQHRQQSVNKEATITAFIQLLQEALHEETPRRKTRVPRGVKEERLKVKKQRQHVKNTRAAKDWGADG